MYAGGSFDGVGMEWGRGPKNAQILTGEGAIFGVVLPHWKCIVTARVPKTAIYCVYNIHINDTIYIPTHFLQILYITFLLSAYPVLFYYRLTQVVLEKRPLNECSCRLVV